MKTNHETFLKLICTEMTYKEIAQKMGVSEVDCQNMAKNLSNKLRVKGRFGLMLYSIKTKLVKPNEIQFKNFGRLTLLEGFKVALGRTVLLEKQSELLGEDEDESRKTYEGNVQKRLSHY